MNPFESRETASFATLACPTPRMLERMLSGELDGPSATEVELHLESCERCQASAAEMAPRPPALLMPGFLAINRAARPRAQRLPDIIGYEVIEEIGRGGMGVVFLARHQALKRDVAIKVISSGRLADDRAIHRLKREAEAIALINDPHVVQVYDIGHAGDLPFLVMELVRGRRLSDTLRESLPPVRDAAALVATLAAAVHRVHRQGVVHRDLKPGNILLASSPSADADATSTWLADRVPKIADFGLARFIDGESTQTPSREIVGTPSYMSPEQARGDGEIGVPADVYGLGAILYELLVGHPPFQSPSAFDVLQQVLHREPLAPTSLRPEVSADLETICLKCLEKDPADRFATAGELAEELGRLLRGEPLNVRPLGATERMIRWSRRHPAQAASIVLGIIACMATAGLATAYPFAMEQQRLVSDLQEEHQETVKALETADAYRRTAEDATTTLAVNQALELCADDDAGRGLNWLAHSLKLCRDDHSGPAIAIRRNLTAWAATVHNLAEIVPNRRELGKLTVSADGQTLAAGTWGCDVLVWNIDESPRTASVLNQPSAVTAIAFTASGSSLATGGFDGSISLWNRSDGSLVARWDAHRQQLADLRFIDDDRRLISAGKDGIVRLWNVADQQPSPSELQHPAPVLSLALIKGASMLLTSCSDGRLRRWSIANGSPEGESLEFLGDVRCVSSNPEGTLYAVSAPDGTVQVFSSENDRPRGKPMQHAAPVSFIAFNADGETLSIAYMDHTARVWNWQTGLPLGSALEHADEVSGLVVNREGTRGITAGDDQTIRCWQLASPVAAEAVSNPQDLPNDLVPRWPGRQSLGMRWREFTQMVGYSPDGRLAYTVAGDAIELQKTRGISLWNTITRESVGPPLLHDAVITDVTFSSGNRLVATADESGCVRIWSGVDGALIAELPTHAGEVTSIAFSLDGERLVSVAADGVRLAECATGRLIGQPWQLDGTPTIAIFDRAGNSVAIGLENGDVILGDAQTQTIKRRLAGNDAGLISMLEFNAENSLLLVSHWGGRLSTWNLTSPSAAAIRADLGEEVWASMLTPDGSKAVAVTASGNLALMDVKTGDRIGVPYRGSTNVNDLAVSPDGTLLAIGTSSGETRLIDAQTAQPIGPPWRNEAPVHFVRFSADARSCYVGDETRSIHRFDVPAPMEGSLSEVTRRVERHTGLSLGADGTMHVLSEDEWDARGDSEEDAD